MHIKAKYEGKAPAAYAAVYDAVKVMAVGEHIRIDGMSINSRDVDTKTVRDLVRAVQYDLGYEFIIGEKHDVVFKTTGGGGSSGNYHLLFDCDARGMINVAGEAITTTATYTRHRMTQKSYG